MKAPKGVLVHINSFSWVSEAFYKFIYKIIVERKKNGKHINKHQFIRKIFIGAKRALICEIEVIFNL